mmetsp:Transcript_30974/g.66501  ORF Transcript_30974/g.66501 Transcript_30974/m.66501 type:complete len:285 (-) Transcript_30974:280-1134(-)
MRWRPELRRSTVDALRRQSSLLRPRTAMLLSQRVMATARACVTAMVRVTGVAPASSMASAIATASVSVIATASVSVIALAIANAIAPASANVIGRNTRVSGRTTVGIGATTSAIDQGIVVTVALGTMTTATTMIVIATAAASAAATTTIVASGTDGKIGIGIGIATVATATAIAIATATATATAAGSATMEMIARRCTRRSSRRKIRLHVPRRGRTSASWMVRRQPTRREMMARLVHASSMMHSCLAPCGSDERCSRRTGLLCNLLVIGGKGGCVLRFAWRLGI